ncbi:MAG TPA: hypothetical protein VMT03_02105 [Polyangia bacterium]|nr:hypothetical protein [Polyangia bacterium]
MAGKRTVVAVIAAAVLWLAGEPAGRAAGKASGPTAAEFAALKQQVERQQELILQLTQLEGEHYEFLLRLFQSGGRASPTPSAGAAPLPRASDAKAPGATSASSLGDAPRGRSAPAAVLGGTITGHVDVEGKPTGPIYVYVDNVKAPLVRNHVIQIAQNNKAFVPATAIVQRGTKVMFPNLDLVLHNVFSPSPTQPFDLGAYRQGDKPGSVTMTNPGVVEVFCNMHSQMRASVLVVPNGYYATVEKDGSFKLENVPTGTRRLVVWTPDARPATQTVEVTSAGASVKLALKVELPQAHNRKDRTPYPIGYPGGASN